MNPEQIKKEFGETKMAEVLHDPKMIEATITYFLDILSKDRESLKAEIEKIWEELPSKSHEDAAFHFKDHLDAVLSLMEQK